MELSVHVLLENQIQIQLLLKKMQIKYITLTLVISIFLIKKMQEKQ